MKANIVLENQLRILHLDLHQQEKSESLILARASEA